LASRPWAGHSGAAAWRGFDLRGGKNTVKTEVRPVLERRPSRSPRPQYVKPTDHAWEVLGTTRGFGLPRGVVGAPGDNHNHLWLAMVLSIALHGVFLAALVVKSNRTPVYQPALYGMGSGFSIVHFVSGTLDGSGEGAAAQDRGLRGSADASHSLLPPLIEISENLSPTTTPLLEATTSDPDVTEETELAEISASEMLQPEPLAAVGFVDGQQCIVGVAGGTISRSPDGQGNSNARGRSDAVESRGGGTGYGLPAYLRNPLPAYPRAAREHGWEGTTLLQVEVLDNGRAGEVEIVRSSGHQILDKAAEEAVRRWRFLPARSGETPIRSLVEIPIHFRLASN